MPLLKAIQLREVYEHIKKGTGKAIADRAFGKAWRLVTPLSDTDATAYRSKLFKSIDKEINDDTKRATLMVLMNALASASNVENYYDFFASSGVDCKEAHAFSHKGQRIKVLELKKLRKKERLYFYPLVVGDVRYFVILLAHHKRDESTNESVSSYCEAQVSALVNASSKLKILE